MRAFAVLAVLAACDYESIASSDAADAAEIDAAEIDAADARAPDAVDAALDALDAGEPDAPIDAPLCPLGARRCEANAVLECQAAAWVTVATCTNLCASGACVTPPSCGVNTSTCGVGANETCCASRPVVGGTFSRSYDGVSPGFTDDRYHATITGLHLDAFEVTAARFQRLVDAYPLSRPADGSGRNPNDALDLGWRSAWTPLLPATRTDLSAALLCDGLVAQTPSDPVRCVSWYVAQAFCIWDGGRLPTEAEWNYAAAGGAEQRVYPWSSPPSSTTISVNHATHQVSAPQRPGAHALGGGRWGHADLAGNVWEWVLDNHASPYPSMACVDCANHTAAAARVTRGGAYLSSSSTVLASFRSSLAATSTRQTTGFRCARNPSP